MRISDWSSDVCSSDLARIRRGRAAYLANRSKLARIEAETGVPESVMVAIWGHETNYGGYMGGFEMPRSLATLASEGRRRPLFSGELIAALQMIDTASGGPQGRERVCQYV